MTGDIVAAMRFAPGTSMAFTQVSGLSDTKAADKAIASMLELFKTGRTVDAMGMSTTIKANPGTTAHDGFTLRSYDTMYDLSKLPPAQRQTMAAMFPGTQTRAQIANFDALGMVVFALTSASRCPR